ncbi:hypothetical protein BT69DRAFT_513563 [Atractiella rhizophila]|nr:hypothetical protein BT69DRAFT_513563 [Atractiella rhizophila]
MGRRLVMAERREKDCPGVSPTIRHLLSPQLPSRSTSHPSPSMLTFHLAFHQPLRPCSRSGLVGPCLPGGIAYPFSLSLSCYTCPY